MRATSGLPDVNRSAGRYRDHVSAVRTESHKHDPAIAADLMDHRPAQRIDDLDGRRAALVDGYESAVRTDAHHPMLSVTSPQHGLLPARRDVPDTDRPVIRAGPESRRIRTEGALRNHIGMSVQLTLLALGLIADHEYAVAGSRSGELLSVGTLCQPAAENRIFQFVDFLPGCHVEHRHGIPGRNHEMLAVGSDDRAVSAGKVRLEAWLRIRVPDSRGCVERCRDEALSVGTESHIGDAALVPLQSHNLACGSRRC